MEGRAVLSLEAASLVQAEVRSADTGRTHHEGEAVRCGGPAGAVFGMVVMVGLALLAIWWP